MVTTDHTKVEQLEPSYMLIMFKNSPVFLMPLKIDSTMVQLFFNTVRLSECLRDTHNAVRRNALNESKCHCFPGSLLARQFKWQFSFKWQ